jgi:hypothetical protein
MAIAPPRALKFRFLPGSFAVCQALPSEGIPDWACDSVFFSITRTADELSIVCSASKVPNELKAEKCWCCIKIEGPFDFHETGVLESFLGPLAEAGIPIFSLSTYNTDYVLVKEQFMVATVNALRAAGHELLP